MNQDQIVGMALKERRDKLGYSLQYVGEKVGRSRYTVRDYETGESKMTWTMFIRICEVLGLDPIQLANSVQATYNAQAPQDRT